VGRELAVTLGWMRSSTTLLLGVVDSLSEADWDVATELPGWRRREVLAHVHRNAEALCNLATWASTGVETPMYPDFSTRDRDIASTAALPAAEIAELVTASAERLDGMLDALEEAHWAAEVRTAQGRTVPASEVPWMRCREVGIHAVDLGAGVGFDDLPSGMVDALARDILELRLSRGEGATLSAWLSGRAPGSEIGPWI
jgi:maleylpyruvate isomerase